jgi:hypothetical protein
MKSADRPPCILSFYRFTEATARLVRVQRLKLMWDYRCWPPWLADSLEPERPARNIAPADLPISSETAAQLLAWAAIPDAKLDEHLEGPQDITWTEEEAHSFEEEGASYGRDCSMSPATSITSYTSAAAWDVYLSPGRRIRSGNEICDPGFSR